MSDMGHVSDGYHTFDELYEHRAALWIALCKCVVTQIPWRSKIHSDGSNFEGWFILGLGVKPGYQKTYHLPEKYWDQCGI